MWTWAKDHGGKCQIVKATLIRRKHLEIKHLKCDNSIPVNFPQISVTLPQNALYTVLTPEKI